MKTESLIQKLILCLLAGLVGGVAFRRIGNRFLSAFLPVKIIVGSAVLILLAAIIYSFVWHLKAKKNTIDSISTSAFWIGVIRYAIALDLSMFGFQKIFHLQFITPLGMLDEPFSSFSGEWLTWSYFGHSYAFCCVIGSLQIIGSLLLVFNRTRLLGLMVIMPVLVNIVFIDYFYGLAPGVLAHAVFMLISAVYLLLLDYDRLVTFFLQFEDVKTSAINHNKVLKNAVRFSILFIPLILIAINEAPNRHPHLKGKYTVTDMAVNGKSMMSTTGSDSLLTLVYLDLANECVFEFNDQKRRMYGTYNLDNKQEQLSITWHYPPSATEKFTGTLKPVQGHLELSGKIGDDALQVKLLKQTE